MRHGLALALAALLGLATIAPQPAWAEQGPREHRVKHQAERPAAAPPRQCRPLCVADVTPCDPMEYKLADGRCPDMFFRF